MFEFDTQLPADSVEFCPHPDAQNILVCGTYKLEENTTNDKPPERHGQCLAFRVTSEQDATFLQAIDLPAILDMSWCHGVPTILAAATSDGVTLMEWDLEESRLVVKSSVQTPDSANALYLCLDWSNRRKISSGLGSLIVSMSNGALSLLRPDAPGSIKVSDVWHAHDHEPWAATWDYWSSDVIYSGGDDLKLKIWDIRQSLAKPAFVNSRFEAGLTSIQSHPHVEHIVAVGSYDNTVRIFDMRKPVSPLAQIDVGGGAWRVKWHPLVERATDLAVACMHDGFKIVNFQPAFDSAQIVQRFDHKSLAYGLDWSYSESSPTVLASCSFYDKTLCLWTG